MKNNNIKDDKLIISSLIQNQIYIQWMVGIADIHKRKILIERATPSPTLELNQAKIYINASNLSLEVLEKFLEQNVKQLIVFSSRKFEIFHLTKAHAIKTDFVSVLPDLLEYYYLECLPEKLNEYINDVFAKLDSTDNKLIDFDTQINHYCDRLNQAYQ